MKPGILLKKIAITCAGIVAAIQVNAIPDLTRSYFPASYTAISSGSGAIMSTATGDNSFEDGIPIGFTFNYLGTNYSAIGVSTNGIAAFTGISADANNMDLYSGSGPNTVLAPWWDDLSITAGTGEILYQTQGTPGNQTFTIQWTNVNSYHSGSTALLNFQIILFEQNSQIEFHYGTVSSGIFNTGSESACIGLKSATGGYGEFIDVVTGSSFTGNAMLCAKTTWPSRSYRFIPGTPAPLAGGTYTVGFGGDFYNLSEAIAEVNHRGVSGTVIFSLTDSLYDETALHGRNFFPMLLGPVAGSSILSSVSFHSQGGIAVISSPGASAGNCLTGSSPTAIGTTNEPVIAMVGCQFVSLNDLNLRSSTINPDRGILVLNSTTNQGTRYCGVNNISISLDRNNSNSTGFEQKSLGAISSYEGSNSWNVYQSLNISNVYSGISLTGNTSFPDSLTNISSSSIGSSGPDDIGNGLLSTSGIYATNQNSIFISGNTIRNVSVIGNVDCSGILIENASGENQISGNRIYNITNHSTSSTADVTGIAANLSNTGTNTFQIFNNFIFGINSDYSGSFSAVISVKGFWIQSLGGGSSASTFNVDFNNVNIHPASVLNSSACLETGTISGPVFKIRNNIFSNSTPAQSGPAAHFCMVSPSALLIGNAGSVSDHNDFYIAYSGRGFIGRGNTTNFVALSDWQNAMSLDAQSLNSDPLFQSSTDLHIHNSSMNSAAIPLSWVINDIDLQVRNAVPDIGADEIFPADPSPISLINPTLNSCYTSAEPMIVRVQNAGNSLLDFTQDTVPLTLTVTGSVSQTFTVILNDNSRNNGNPLPIGAYVDVLMGTINMSGNGTYIFNAHTSLYTDGNPYNDTLQTIVITVASPHVTITGNTMICSSASTTLTANATGGDGSYNYQWSPGLGTNATVTVSPSQDATYYVSIVDGCGIFANDSIFVQIIPDPVAAFTFNQNMNTVQFSESSQNTSSWSWDFGDLQSSTQQNPSHTYAMSGTYTVVLTTTNACGNDTATTVITIIETGITAINGNSGISIFPDPNEGQFTVYLPWAEQNVEMDLEDVNGKLLQKNKFTNTSPNSNFILNVNEFENGIYFLRIYSDDFSEGRKIIIRK